MAHFAQLDNNNVVTQVIVVNNNELLDATGNESEAKGIQFLHDTFGPNLTWVKTSYNNNIRKRYAGIGFTYNQQLDAFIPPQPFPSWVLNQDTADWQAPVALPADAATQTNPNGKLYIWDESKVNWVLSPNQPVSNTAPTTTSTKRK